MTTGVIAAAAAAAIVLIVAGIWLIRRRRDAPIDTPEEAADAAERALAGFVVADAVVATDGQAALAVGTDGRVAAIRRRGRRVTVSEVAWASVRATGLGIVIEPGERRPDEVRLTGVDALDIRRLVATRERAAG